MKRVKSESLDPFNTQILHTDAKRSKLSSQKKEYSYNLLDLSDDVLLHIFKYLSSFDIMSLHLCCFRLSELCCDRTLWKSLDLRAQHLSLEELEKYVRFMQPVTKLLAIRGNKRKNEFPELHPSFLNTVALKCEQLQDFILEDYSISQEKIQITNFPKTLKKLSLKGCQIFKGHLMQMNKSYLSKIDIHMPNLTCLILTNCNWLNSHSFMAISKIPKLKEVRLNSCYGLSEDIAYASLACRYGLKSLEVLDLKDTFVGDSVISSFSHTSTLTDIYLECPNSEAVQHQPDEHPQQREVLYVQLQRGPEVVYQNNHVNVELINENDLHHLIVNLVNNADRCQISDRSICALGLRNNENNQEIIHNRDEVQLVQGRPRTSTNPNLKKLIVRNYTGVTNQTLLHFVVNGPNLEYLDVTGTSVTKEGLQYFKIQRPDVNLVSSFDEI
ncbi:PREDICTED: uncharacterized protein LOC105362194 [Ceratosolen solmsi marchali]|uniref:Uncharacterized protein LOC105362194 n=1 Tax=Ceratosolen solmsi marchali TaxID=326594 RepID=A0AAJ6YGX5_9HYME|nr:PREDICTED: uncharacterized protein LOC105362194 [Ceratosolen solmsi marchali]